LVTPNQKQQDLLHLATSTVFSISLRVVLAAGRSFVSSGLRSRITTSSDIPLRAHFLKHSRINRLATFRCVEAGNIRLLTDIPSRACPAEFNLLWTANHELVCALCCNIRENPSRRVSR
jgi:hypothetical protein